MSIDFDDIAKQVPAIIGETLWQIKLGVGTMLTAEFGDKRHIGHGKHSKIVGEWSLWVYDAAWEILHQGEIVTGYLSARANQNMILDQLIGLQMNHFEFNHKTFTAEFSIGKKWQIRIYPKSESNLDQWMLTLPNRYVITFNTDGKWEYEFEGEV